MSEIIPFHKPTITGQELAYFNQYLETGNTDFIRLCEKELMTLSGAKSVLLTTSCTHALELCALLLDIQAGDEIIMPSFNFVSAANAFVLRGAKVVFVDIDPQTMNIDADKLDDALSTKTKAVLVMHYGGVACDMKSIRAFTQRHNIRLIEDAAHCIDAYADGQHLGTFGDLGTFSFHYTKNVHCTEGGALLINDPALKDRAEILRSKGTNQGDFRAGKVDRYTWVDIGSSYSLGEINAAMLWAQLGACREITKKRLLLWNCYYEELEKSLPKDYLPYVPDGCVHNGHLFYIRCRNMEERTALQKALAESGISAYFHYVPLHSSEAGRKWGVFVGEDKYTTSGSEALLRLPLYDALSREDVIRVCTNISRFFSISNNVQD